MTTNLRNRKTNDNLNGMTILHQSECASLREFATGSDFSRISNRDTQTRCTF